MDKQFDPRAVEPRISAMWEAEGCFRVGRPERRDALGFCIVIPPPNVTGSLHIGHALNTTLQDVLCRYWRMRGRDVLWQPGTDHAGIATQMVVERKLAAENRTSRAEMGRDAFLREVWAWKEQSGGQIRYQLKRLGASCDWSRERFTMDEGLSRAVLKVFVELHRRGLVYKDRRLVNWDPKLLTAVSDLEVETKEVRGSLWHLRYPIVDDAGAETGEFLTVATTRPETMLGDTAVAVHPDDERYAGLVTAESGWRVRLPLVGRLIPIVADAYSDPEKGTGAVKVTPAHDFNDFEVGRRHDLAAITVLSPDGTISLEEIEPDLRRADGTLPDALRWIDGLDRFEARKRIVSFFEEAGLLDRVEAHVHAVPHGDRSGVVIEPRLTDQWYVDVKPLAERALAAVRHGRTRFVPVEREKTFFHWLENIQPWCVSRQLWWGHQIPAWYGPDGSVFVAETEGEAGAQALAHAVTQGLIDEAEGARIAADPDALAAFVRRDPDVLDTWFSSALWPYSTLGWPEKTPELEKFYPNDVLVTAPDIIFFWVARMMMTGLDSLDEVPFRDVLIHGIVRDEKGKKMSKTVGNVIDPLTVVDEYGADALRFTLAAMTAQGRDMKLAVGRVEGYRNFATKLWNAARFAEMNGCRRAEGFDPAAVRLPLNRWILGQAAEAIADTAQAIEGYRFNDATSAAYRFAWNSFCDWHLEFAKPILTGPDGVDKEETRATVAHVLDLVCGMLHPFMPFLTEELWRIKGEDGPARQGPLALGPWPDAPTLDARASADAEAEIGWVVDLVTGLRSARSELNVPPSALLPLVLVTPRASTLERARRWEDAIARMGRVASIVDAPVAPGQALQVVVRGEVVAVPLGGVIDLAAETRRLDKDREKLAGEIAKIDAKLANADFLSRAPDEVVDEQRARRAEASDRAQRLAEALSRLR